MAGVIDLSRLFAGTPWDRPLVCTGCGRLESECVSSAVPEVKPSRQSSELRPDDRAPGEGKLVTVIAGLSPEDDDLSELATQLKNACSVGGTVKDGQIEIQGDHLQAAQRTLQTFGYKTKVAGR